MAIPAGYLEATWIMQCNLTTRPSTWSCGFNDDAENDPDPGVVAQAFYTFSTSSPRPWAANVMSNQFTFKGVSVTKMTESGPVVGEYLQDLPGTAVFGSPPLNLAILVNKRTASGGRRNRGRMFVSVATLPETAVGVDGKLTTTELGAQQTAYTALRSSMVTAGYSPVLFHTTGSQFPTPITAFVVQQLCATQRRRMRK